MKNPYEDIINLPHHVSATRLPMSMIDRAAQFSPFAALTGYDSAIKETGRLTGEKIDMSEDACELLDRKFRKVVEQLDQIGEVCLLYFVPDERKSGGEYKSVTGTIKMIDEIERFIIMQDLSKIPMDNVIDIRFSAKDNGMKG